MPENSGQPRTALLLIDIQDGFLNTTHWGPARSNPEFEKNISSLLTTYRSLISSTPENSRHKIIHIAHSSLSPTSPLHPSSPGFAFQPFVTPKEGELIIKKNVNSAFIGTNLEAVLREHFLGGKGTLYLTGLTTDHWYVFVKPAF
jgi:nicotinamidase-related amidase